jgi:hypothetical protein
MTGASITLAGQTALVTGGGRGIGRAIALALARAGAAVAVLARSAEQLADVMAAITASGGRAIALPAGAVVHAGKGGGGPAIAVAPGPRGGRLGMTETCTSPLVARTRPALPGGGKPVCGHVR